MKYITIFLCISVFPFICFFSPAIAGVDLEKINIGGALRATYYYQDWNEINKDKSGDFGFDIFRINMDGEIGDMLLSAEYRWYPEYDMNTIHHGWIGYDFNESWQGQIGVHQVPFGIQPFASHNFWFSGAYYVGFEDDYDMGIKALYNEGPLSLSLAFYKNGELGNAANASRYSVDVMNFVNSDDPSLSQNNEETNQGNIRLAYTFTHDNACSTEMGISGEYGGIYNSDTTETGDHWAGAVHMVGNYGRWNIQIEGIQYEYDPENPDTTEKDLIYVGAFDSNWGMPMKAHVGIFNIAYGLPVNIGPVSKLTFYSDNTIIQADNEGENWEPSWQNVVGCMISAGPVFTYVDVISAENMIFMGGNLNDDVNNRNTRININFGYYF